MRFTQIARHRAALLSLVSLLTLVGCSGAEGTEGEEALGVTQSALITFTDFSPDTPSMAVIEGKSIMATRVGANVNATDVLYFSHFYREVDNLLPTWFGGDSGPQKTRFRPFQIWNTNASSSSFTTLYNDATSSDFAKDSTLNLRLLPSFNGAPLSSPSALDQMTASSGNTCAFGAYDNAGSRIIMQSCSIANTDFWEDWGLELPAPGSTLTPNTGPMVYRRSPNSDSLMYGCGSGATQACEYRISGPRVGSTYTFDFGSGAFMANTRPTGISNSPRTTSAKPWFFAATLNGSTRALLSRRETSALDATTPTYQTDAAMTIESTTANVTYSTPMPYNRSDGSLGVVYHRTLSGSTTRIYEAVWSGSAWTTKEVYDTGLVMPAATEPAPNAESIAPGVNGGDDLKRNAIAFRQPAAAANDVVVLWQGPSISDGYSRVLLPQSQSAGFNYAGASSNFADPLWNPTGVSATGVAAAVTAGPAGDLIQEIREASGTGQHGITQNFFVGNRAVPYRWSIYLKKDSRSAVKLTLDSFDDAASSVSAFVDLSTGLISSFSTAGTGTYLGSSSESVGNGWYRVSLVGKPTTASGSLISIHANLLASVNGTVSYAGDTSKRLFASSAELMVYNGPFAGAPAPTGLSATAGNAQVALGWTAATGAASYNVYRSTTAGAEGGTPVATGIAGTSYTNTGLTNGTNYFFKVAAVRAGGPSLLSNEASAKPSAPVSLFMNCGGGATGSWVADTNTGGFTRSWANAVNTSLLTGTIPPQAVLQTGRLGNLTYNFSGFTASSSHTVTLYFVENFFTAAGKRIFTVSSNGSAKLSSFDIFAAAGAQFKAVQRSFTATADGSGKIALTFVPSVDNASIEGIVVQ